MSVLKDWFHGITPAERKRIEAEKELEYQKWLRETRENKITEEILVREKIYNSPVTNKIANDLIELFSQDIWYHGKDYFGHPYSFPAKDVIPHATIYVDKPAVEVYSSGKDNFHTCFYSFNFEQNGYKDLSGDLDRKYFIGFITTKLKAVLPNNCYFEYYATMGSDSVYWKNSRPDSPRCDRICIRQKDPDPIPQQPLKSW